VETAKHSERVRFGFPAAPRSGDVAVRIEGLRKSYGDRVVYDGLDLVLRRGDRVALVGPNGAGKSTLLKLLAGRTPHDGGRLELGHNVTTHYYAQHQLEALDPEATALEEVARVAPPGQRERLRTLLGSFLFHGDDVEKRVGVLSGGEKARLALAKLLIRPANLLLLDEPTNHLDLRSAEVLEDALNEYTGTLVLISHDRYFINRVATQVAAIGQGRAELFDGDYDEYVAQVARRTVAPEPPARDAVEGSAGVSGEAGDRQARRRAEAEERNRRYRARVAVEQRLAPLEARIADLEQRLADLDAAQADPALYRDPTQSAALGRERLELTRRLEEAWAAWAAEGDAGG
jgi:ATP-binding cassette subfamily F protein 3